MSPHRFDASNKAFLTDETRRKLQPPGEIIMRANTTPDEVIADLGCGTGFMTVPLARRCRTVIALDSQREMLDTLIASLAPELRPRVHPVLANLPTLPFAPATIDRFVLVNVFHELEDKDRLALEIETSLAPGGRLTLVDFPKRVTSFGPPLKERMAPEEVLSHFQSLVVIGLWETDEYYQIELGRL